MIRRLALTLCLALPASAQESVPLPPTRPDAQIQQAIANQLAARQVQQALRPPARPKSIPAMAQRLQRQQTQARTRGQLCGVPGIEGGPVASISNGRCGIARPVAVRAVSGLRLTTPATIDCNTAKALKTWVDRSLIPSVGARGGGVARIHVMASYACRTRNSQPGAKLSEHALGHAVDIGGVQLNDGSRISVKEHWGRGWKGQILERLWRDACGPFGTVLGPRANRFHHDHFHFDTARYRSGSYCR